MDASISAINENQYYRSPIMKLSASAYSDLDCNGTAYGNYCSFGMQKFPSKKFKNKNFKYVLEGVMKHPRQMETKQIVLA